MIFDNEPFLFIDPPKSLPGAGFILSTEPPFYIGKVIKMKPEEVDSFVIKETKVYAFCMGYSVVILAAGSLLEGQPLSPYKTTPSVERIRQMAAFYLIYRIDPNAGRYKRYKL